MYSCINIFLNESKYRIRVEQNSEISSQKRKNVDAWKYVAVAWLIMFVKDI